MCLTGWHFYWPLCLAILPSVSNGPNCLADSTSDISKWPAHSVVWAAGVSSSLLCPIVWTKKKILNIYLSKKWLPQLVYRRKLMVPHSRVNIKCIKKNLIFFFNNNEFVVTDPPTPSLWLRYKIWSCGDKVEIFYH